MELKLAYRKSSLSKEILFLFTLFVFNFQVSHKTQVFRQQGFLIVFIFFQHIPIFCDNLYYFPEKHSYLTCPRQLTSTSELTICTEYIFSAFQDYFFLFHQQSPYLHTVDLHPLKCLLKAKPARQLAMAPITKGNYFTFLTTVEL